MQLNELITIASAAYSDGLIAVEYWDFKRERPKRNAKGGDTLALFIALEIKDTYDPETSEELQLETAARALSKAQDELRVVCEALEAEVEKRRRAEK